MNSSKSSIALQNAICKWIGEYQTRQWPGYRANVLAKPFVTNRSHWFDSCIDGGLSGSASIEIKVIILRNLTRQYLYVSERESTTMLLVNIIEAGKSDLPFSKPSTVHNSVTSLETIIMKIGNHADRFHIEYAISGITVCPWALLSASWLLSSGAFNNGIFLSWFNVTDETSPSELLEFSAMSIAHSSIGTPPRPHQDLT